MSAAADLTLDQLAADPYALLARLRIDEPVAWIPAMGGWLVTRRDLAAAVLRDAATFTVDDPRFSTAQVIGPSMLSTDGAEHDRHRRPFADPFRRPAVRDRFTDWIEQRARALIAGLGADGRAELRSRLAAPLAVEVAAEAVGLRLEDRPAVTEWYDAIVGGVDEITAGGPVPAAATEAYAALRAAVDRAAGEPGSLVARMTAAGGLSAAEVAANVAVILFGGVVTSEGATASALYHLLGDPEQLERVRADRSLVANAVEESLRLEPAAAVVDRYATRNADLGGAAVRAGDLVRVSLLAANRDPAVFPDPDRFDASRTNASQHLTFAVGPHACLGIHLARLESRIAVDAVLDMLPRVRLDRRASTPPAGLIFRSPGRVGATWG